jgi:hypothetical protein
MAVVEDTEAEIYQQGGDCYKTVITIILAPYPKATVKP